MFTYIGLRGRTHPTVVVACLGWFGSRTFKATLSAGSVALTVILVYCRAPNPKMGGDPDTTPAHSSPSTIHWPALSVRLATCCVVPVIAAMAFAEETMVEKYCITAFPSPQTSGPSRNPRSLRLRGY